MNTYLKQDNFFNYFIEDIENIFYSNFECPSCFFDINGNNWIDHIDGERQ